VRFSAAEALLASGIDRDQIRQALPRVDPSQVPVYRASGLFRLFWSKGITAVALPWGIYLAPEALARPLDQLGSLIVHELTHIEQWRRLGPVGWARSYLGDYLRGRRTGLGHHEAYRAIGLEEEARERARQIRKPGPV
jgi:hypothetical protein